MFSLIESSSDCMFNIFLLAITKLSQSSLASFSLLPRLDSITEILLLIATCFSSIKGLIGTIESTGGTVESTGGTVESTGGTVESTGGTVVSSDFVSISSRTVSSDFVSVSSRTVSFNS